MNKDSRNIFKESLSRCKQRPDFVDQFYDRFLATSNEVKAKFVKTNFAVQKIKLLKSLEMTVLALEGVPQAMRELEDRALTHSRAYLDIRPELYDFWRESLLQTVVICDEQYDKEVEQVWREATNFIINTMLAKY